MAQQTRPSLMGLFMRLYGSFAGKGAATPDQPGLEFSFPANRPHAMAPVNRPHFEPPVNRPHFTLPREVAL